MLKFQEFKIKANNSVTFLFQGFYLVKFQQQCEMILEDHLFTIFGPHGVQSLFKR